MGDVQSKPTERSDKVRPAQQQSRGEANGAARLTEEDVRAIRTKLREHPETSRRALGREYGVSGMTIIHIEKRKTWADLVDLESEEEKMERHIAEALASIEEAKNRALQSLSPKELDILAKRMES